MIETFIALLAALLVRDALRKWLDDPFRYATDYKWNERTERTVVGWKKRYYAKARRWLAA